jgi:hypothetical protein
MAKMNLEFKISNREIEILKVTIRNIKSDEKPYLTCPKNFVKDNEKTIFDNCRFCFLVFNCGEYLDENECPCEKFGKEKVLQRLYENIEELDAPLAIRVTQLPLPINSKYYVIQIEDQKEEVLEYIKSLHNETFEVSINEFKLFISYAFGPKVELYMTGDKQYTYLIRGSDSKMNSNPTIIYGDEILDLVSKGIRELNKKVKLFKKNKK